MGELTALEILQSAADQLKLARPSSITASDPQTRQLLRFCNKTGRDLVKRRDWEELQTEHVIEFGAPTELLADTTAGSPIVTVPSTAALSAEGAAFWSVTGEGIQIACRIQSITDATTLVLTETVDATQSGVTLTFTQDTFDLPSDWKRDIEQTQWDRRFQWRLIGPDSPQTDQWHRSGIVTIGPRRRFRRRGYPLRLRIWPPPSASSDYPGTLVYEYIGKSWAESAAGVRQTSFAADDDVHVFQEDDLLIDGIKWRYWHISGLPWQTFAKEYYEGMDMAKAASGGAPILSTNKRRAGYLITPANIQDGNFPSE